MDRFTACADIGLVTPGQCAVSVAACRHLAPGNFRIQAAITVVATPACKLVIRTRWPGDWTRAGYFRKPGDDNFEAGSPGVHRAGGVRWVRHGVRLIQIKTNLRATILLFPQTAPWRVSRWGSITRGAAADGMQHATTLNLIS